MIGCRTKNKLLKNWQENKIWQPLASDREISLQSQYNILNSRSIDKKEICKLRTFHIYICDDDSTKEKSKNRMGVDSLVFNIGKAGDQVVQTCWDGFAYDCSWQKGLNFAEETRHGFLSWLQLHATQIWLDGWTSTRTNSAAFILVFRFWSGNHRIEFFWCVNLSLLLTDEGAITPKLVSGWD